MATLLNPFLRALDANADSVSGGLLYVFEAGTTTPVTTYSDRAMTTAQSQPLVANAAGEFAAVFVPSGTYKIRVADSGAVVLYENDYVRMADRPDDPVTLDDEAAVEADDNEYADGTILFALTEATYFEVAPSGATTYDLTNAAGEKLRYKNRRYETVSGLTGSGEGSRGEGAIWLAGRYTYIEAASGATDHHITTARGVKLYVQATYGAYGLSYPALALGINADGATDDCTAVQSFIDKIGAAGGGAIDFDGKSIAIDSANGLSVNSDNIFITNARFVRTESSNTGWTIQFAETDDTSGGGVVNVEFVGIPTLAANAGLGMAVQGASGPKADGYILDNIKATGFGQYGVGIGEGSNWNARHIRVEEHGLTSGSLSACIGFYVYPKTASSGGVVHDVYSEMSADAIANASLNSAAVKLQTHQKFTASQITGIGGSESCFVVDSVEGAVSDILVYPQGDNVGLNVGNNNTAHSFSGQIFTLDGATIFDDGGYAFVIGAAADGSYKLDGCTVRNISCPEGAARFLTRSNYRNCVFENWRFADIRLDSVVIGGTDNTVLPTNNTLSNIVSTAGLCALAISDSVIDNVGTREDSGAGVSYVQFRGDSNDIGRTFSRGADTTNSLQIDGDYNTVQHHTIDGLTTGRSVWFKTGSFGNQVNGNLSEGTGVLDNGDNLWQGQEVLAAEMTDAAKAVNVVGKYAGKTVKVLSNNKLVMSTGDDPTDVWRYADATTAYTPA